MASWHFFLLLAVALSGQRWDGTVARQGLGSVLLALAAWQLGSVSAGQAERSVRHGLVVTLDKALSGTNDHQVTR